MHGTAIAGAIAAHARLMGAAPAAKILAIRAFGSAASGAEATTAAIRKGIEYASVQHARIINMSFAGPSDPGLARHLAAAKAQGAVLIAASGNFGPKSPPQFPASDANVIAVSATDADDHLFRASNIGPHIAVAAPGVDILLPVPDNDYELISGTSFSAAYVSGVAALVLQRAPDLTPDAVRDILESTAKDLGPAGKDPEFGAGLVDAYQAILAVQPKAAASEPQEVSAQAKPQ
jgi:subtilisin family serine protease